MTHYVELNIFLVKVPTVEHEAAHGIFRDKVIIRAARMGLEDDLISIGATKFKTPRVSKEGDSALKPRSMRPLGADWPTIVLESGWSESLTKLRQDGHIWLENSGGDVKIVLLFSIGRTARTMMIEKWENRPVPANPSAPTNPPVPANPPVPPNRPPTRSMTRAAATPPNQPPPQTPTQGQ